MNRYILLYFHIICYLPWNTCVHFIVLRMLLRKLMECINNVCNSLKRQYAMNKKFNQRSLGFNKNRSWAVKYASVSQHVARIWAICGHHEVQIIWTWKRLESVPKLARCFVGGGFRIERFWTVTLDKSSPSNVTVCENWKHYEELLRCDKRSQCAALMFDCSGSDKLNKLFIVSWL